jgi:hypothetical protein
MQQVLEILDYTVGIFIVIILLVFLKRTMNGQKVRFSRFSLAMMCISFCDMVIDGLQGEIVSLIISGLLCLFWIYNYKKDRKHEITL